jgi:hypothetical protein
LKTSIAISLSSSRAQGASTRVARTDRPISDSPRFVLTAFSHAQANRPHHRARSSASCLCSRSRELWNAMEEAMPAPTTARLPPKPAEVKKVPHRFASGAEGGRSRAVANAPTATAAVTRHHPRGRRRGRAEGPAAVGGLRRALVIPAAFHEGSDWSADCNDRCRVLASPDSQVLGGPAVRSGAPSGGRRRRRRGPCRASCGAWR